ncbi:hypothetical protein LTR94_038695, partial [Friedmanniomyces endolithicus]
GQRRRRALRRPVRHLHRRRGQHGDQVGRQRLPRRSLLGKDRRQPARRQLQLQGLRHRRTPEPQPDRR